jgi:hypothetical protein
VRKILSATGFNVILNEAGDGGQPRADGRPGCMIAIRPGANLVPDELLEHHYLRAYIDAGLVTVPVFDAPEPSRAISKYLRDDFYRRPPAPPGEEDVVGEFVRAFGDTKKLSKIGAAR